MAPSNATGANAILFTGWARLHEARDDEMAAQID